MVTGRICITLLLFLAQIDAVCGQTHTRRSGTHRLPLSPHTARPFTGNNNIRGRQTRQFDACCTYRYLLSALIPEKTFVGRCGQLGCSNPYAVTCVMRQNTAPAFYLTAALFFCKLCPCVPQTYSVQPLRHMAPPYVAHWNPCRVSTSTSITSSGTHRHTSPRQYANACDRYLMERNNTGTFSGVA